MSLKIAHENSCGSKFETLSIVFETLVVYIPEPKFDFNEICLLFLFCPIQC